MSRIWLDLEYAKAIRQHWPYESLILHNLHGFSHGACRREVKEGWLYPQHWHMAQEGLVVSYRLMQLLHLTSSFLASARSLLHHASEAFGHNTMPWTSSKDQVCSIESKSSYCLEFVKFSHLDSSATWSIDLWGCEVNTQAAESISKTRPSLCGTLQVDSCFLLASTHNRSARMAKQNIDGMQKTSALNSQFHLIRCWTLFSWVSLNVMHLQVQSFDDSEWVCVTNWCWTKDFQSSKIRSLASKFPPRHQPVWTWLPLARHGRVERIEHRTASSYLHMLKRVKGMFPSTNEANAHVGCMMRYKRC